ncbi:MAG TPA: peptidylprolyl isomerase [Polyangiaceae bacterium]
MRLRLFLPLAFVGLVGCSGGSYLLSNIVEPPDSGVVDAGPVEAAAPVDAGLELYVPQGYELVPYVTDTATTRKFKAPDQVLDSTKSYVVVLDTDVGRIVWELFTDDAPIACNSFVFLTLHHYFDGIAFHRVIDQFFAQGGDPNTIKQPQSTWGLGGPGYTFDNENAHSDFDAGGLVAMANTGQPNSNGSQFFITFEAQSLVGGYTLFGNVTEGADILPKIVRGEAPDDVSNPGYPTRIVEAHIAAKAK